MQVNQEFVLQLTTLVCPTCNSMFGTDIVVSSPPITKDTVVEADLHRVLPKAAIRASFIALCPSCGYAWWVEQFKSHPYNPKMVPAATEMEFSKRFAHAILSGRKNGAHSLDLAMLALNGGWCAREDGGFDIRWLELAHHELENALKGDDWDGNRGYYHYILGEVCRQLKDFGAAIQHFERVTAIAQIPQELVDRQKVLAIAGDSNPAIMPVHLVESMYCQDTSTAGLS